jgi:uncharacterized membrane protein YbaN (DUF454 family)
MEPTSTPGPRVVHSSRGRLRVHLPDSDGHITTRLRGLPGVTSAEASELTGNILILYDHRQTSEKALLDELQAPPAVAPPGELPPVEPADQPTGMYRRLYQALGWSSVGIGGVGAVTPGLPTVPFLILAGYFFVRSSPQAHDWLLRSSWFGPSLRDWEEHHGVRRSVKYTAVGVMGAGLAVTWLLGLPAAVIAAILALEVVGLVTILRIPEIEPSGAGPQGAEVSAQG